MAFLEISRVSRIFKKNQKLKKVINFSPDMCLTTFFSAALRRAIASDLDDFPVDAVVIERAPMSCFFFFRFLPPGLIGSSSESVAAGAGFYFLDFRKISKYLINRNFKFFKNSKLEHNLNTNLIQHLKVFEGFQECFLGIWNYFESILEVLWSYFDFFKYFWVLFKTPTQYFFEYFGNSKTWNDKLLLYCGKFWKLEKKIFWNIFENHVLKRKSSSSRLVLSATGISGGTISAPLSLSTLSSCGLNDEFSGILFFFSTTGLGTAVFGVSGLFGVKSGEKDWF